jgi:3' terminal RNA ribose 2'-O-methyltransferase Hen1
LIISHGATFRALHPNRVGHDFNSVQPRHESAAFMFSDHFVSSSQMDGISDLHEARLDQVVSRLKASGARRILDLGCGSGQLLHRLAGEKQFKEIVGLESCPLALTKARQLLEDYMPDRLAQLTLINGSYTDPQESLSGYDAVAMVETIEHVKPNLLSAAEQVVFGSMRPGVVFLTTPNREYNPLYGLGPNEFRERDHKFEWNRAKFSQWAHGVARRNGYRVLLGVIGEEDPELGAPTQTAYFSRQGD